MEAFSERIVTVYRSGESSRKTDLLIDQTELTITVNGGRPEKAVCSPGAPEALCLGRLLGSGRFLSGDPLPEIRIRGGIASVLTAGGRKIREPSPVVSEEIIPMESVLESMERFAELAGLFRKTGGTHSAALGIGREVVCHFEDVSRASALEKTLGMALASGMDTSGAVLLLSSRIPRDFVRTAAAAGVPVMAAMSAPTCQAAEEAERLGICLCGFVRGKNANVYSHPWRLGL